MSFPMQTVSAIRRDGMVVVNTKSHSFRGHIKSVNGAVLVLDVRGTEIAVPTAAIKQVRPLGEGEKP